MSDILLIICDVRNPLFHCPPTLYDYIVNEKKKKMIIVLNKIDLVDQNTVLAWKQYFGEIYPSVAVVTFSTNPNLFDQKKGNYRKYFVADGVIELIQV